MNIPTHIGFIMDGNGRWAKQRKLPRTMGHREGVNALEKVVFACRDRGIKVVSVYAFSTENWNRPKAEVNALFGMITKFTKTRLEKYASEGIRVTFMGDLTVLPEDCQESIKTIIEKTKKNSTLTFNICLNYSGRQEILYAVNKLLSENKTSVTEEEFKNAMFSKGLPDPDIIVRSSGEMRISNFMLYEIAYSEFIFIDDLWPDFDEKTVDKILEIYQKRDRRFGRISEE